jgi:LmbE family N-acetylglucosaminyl deacetylase
VPTLLHVSPHADDEALGAPATLLLLLDRGWRIVNVVTSLGGPTDHDRRRRETIDAATRAGIELVLPDARSVEELVAALASDCHADVVMSPAPDDAHPRHVAVAQATDVALASLRQPPVWWQWGLWADLPHPTLYVPFGDELLARAQHVLGAYAGELARNDYSRLLTARAVAHAVLGSERVFGFGSARASTEPYAELLTELRRVDGTWKRGEPRLFTHAAP